MTDPSSLSPSDEQQPAMGPPPSLEDFLLERIKTLNERIWELRASGPKIDQWLDNFAKDGQPIDPSERLHALFLLSKFAYFGDREMRELLRALFRDVYEYPIVAQARMSNGDTTDEQIIRRYVLAALSQTRFLGVGNPSESGTHLLYHFRQVNGLSKDQFITPDQIFERLGRRHPVLRERWVRRYVFIDDFCGSGDQAVERSSRLLSDIRSAAVRSGVTVEIAYYVLVATVAGITAVRSKTSYDKVAAVVELDSTFACFDTNSRYFRNCPHRIIPSFAKLMCEYYGMFLSRHAPLGHAGSQLLIGFHHNTPDNTLPIFWHEAESSFRWAPIFLRYPKIEAGGGP